MQISRNLSSKNATLVKKIQFLAIFSKFSKFCVRAWLEGVAWQKSCKFFAKNVEKMAKFVGILAKKWFKPKISRAWLEGVARGRGMAKKVQKC